MTVADGFYRTRKRGANNRCAQSKDAKKIIDSIKLSLALEPNADVAAYLEMYLCHTSMRATLMYLSEFNQRSESEG